MPKITRLPSLTGSPAPEIGERGSVPICLESHLQWCRLRGLKENSIYQRGRAVTRLRDQLGIDLFTVDRQLLEHWREGLGRLSDTGIVSEVSHVKQFYSWAAETGHVTVNPAAKLPVPRLGRRLPRPISEQDLLGALACAPRRIRPWLVLAGWAGLRAKEIALLRRQSVLEKSRPPYLLIAADATKGRNERAVPMSDFVSAELIPVLPRSGWVFTRWDGQAGPNHPARVSKLVNAHLDDCGIDATLHQLRHRFLSGVYQATKDLRLTQELAGHSSPVTTAGYAAVNQADAVAAVAALGTPRRLRAAR